MRRVLPGVLRGRHARDERKRQRMSAAEQFIDAIADAVARRLESKLAQSHGTGRRLFTVDEAAEYLGYTPAAIRHMVAKDQLPSVRVGRSLRFDIADLDRWIEEHKNGGTR